MDNNPVTNPDNTQLIPKLEDDNASNVSYSSKDDDDQILTATITFDVTVDPSGQVISASEGHIVAETTADGRKMSLSDHQRLPSVMKGEAISEEPPQESVIASNIEPSHTIKLQDSLEESDTDDSTSTSTESLIERSKKYMNQEAGIIILKRDNTTSKNFNINLDFDLKNDNGEAEKSEQYSSDGKNFNINLDIDVPRSNDANLASQKEENIDSEKNFNINLDFDLKNNRPNSQLSRKRGVDIDLMITSSTTTSKIEKLEENLNEETIDDYLHTIQERASIDLEPSRVQSIRNLDQSYFDSNAGVNRNRSQIVKDITEAKHIEDNNSKFNFIERLVHSASNKETIDKEIFYRKHLHKADQFNLEQCIDGVLNDENSKTPNTPVLRPFETVDFEALTKGFEPEEVKEGKLVLYITEPQLLQLLKQRAIIVPDKNKLLKSHDFGKQTLSLVDENIGNKLGRNSPIKEVELVVDQDHTDKYRPIQSVSNIRENNPGTQSRHSEPEDNALKAVDDLVDRLINKNQSGTNSGRSSRAYGVPLRETPSIQEPHESHLQSSQFAETCSRLNDYTQNVPFSGGNRTSRHETYESKSNGNIGELEFIESDHALKAVDELVDRILNSKPKKTYSMINTDYDNKFENFKKETSVVDGYDELGSGDFCPTKIGSNGKNGRNGKQGKNGRDGEDFFVIKDGIDGLNGKNGRNGRPGKDGKIHFINDDINRIDSQIQNNDRVVKSHDTKFPGSTDERDSIFSDLLDDRKQQKLRDVRNGLDGIDGIDGIDGSDGRNAIDIYRALHSDQPSESNFSNGVIRQPGNQRPSNRVGLSYTDLTEPSQNIGKISDPKLLSYKDFDLLLPSDKIKGSPSTPFEYIKIGGEKDVIIKNAEKTPKSYEILNQSLDFTKFNDEEVPKVLEKLISRVSSSIDEDTCSVNLKNLSESYQNPEDNEKLDLLKKFRNSLKPNKDDEERLKLLDKLIEKLLKPDDSHIPAKETISHLEGIKSRFKDIPKRYARSPDSIKKSIIDVNSNKIIIKTTRKLPSKVYTTCNSRDTKQFLKKKIVYSYQDDLKPNTKVYEIPNNGKVNKENVSKTQNLNSFNNSYLLNYSLKPFEPVNPSEQITRASVDQINKYLSVFNTGVQNNDLVQIHPILNSHSKIKTYENKIDNSAINSSIYPNYNEEITKQFGGLQITDFPLYVQGLDEYNETSLSIKNSNNQEDIEQTVSQQVVNSLNEFAKANSINNRSIVLA